MSYQDLLNKKAGEVETPKPTPEGTYEFVISGPAENGEIGADKTPIVTFPCKIAGAIEVDDDDIEEFGGMDKVIGRGMRLRFFITDDALFRLRRFLVEHLGMDEDETLAELIADAQNAKFAGVVEHQPSRREGDDTIYANINQTMNLDDLD